MFNNLSALSLDFEQAGELLRNERERSPVLTR
uniref:Uncharacterized protein n=1 Tax=Anguilla anguilla TaxID=7936 RepID=A0A0E9VB93_ANGAN